MDMHAAALPPIHGPVRPEDTRHPRYPEYRTYRYNMTRLMVRADGFQDWLSHSERAEESDRWAAHPQYPAFLAWMTHTKAGARKCRPTRDMPYGLRFPANFKVWLQGERW